jgi:hypothetical protein
MKKILKRSWYFLYHKRLYGKFKTRGEAVTFGKLLTQDEWNENLIVEIEINESLLPKGEMSDAE